MLILADNMKVHETKSIVRENKVSNKNVKEMKWRGKDNLHSFIFFP